MFHVKKCILTSMVGLINVIGLSQGTYSYKPGEFNIVLPEDTSVMRIIKETPVYSTLSGFENDMLYAINYVRLNPSKFKQEALDPYLELYPQLKAKYGESLQRELVAATPVNSIEVEGRLVKLARAHAADLAKNSIMSHNSSNGTSFQQRFEREGITCGSECINGGQPVSALEALLSLLIDFNVSNFGHRKSLLNPTMTSVGIGSSFSNDNKRMRLTVIDLGCF